MSIALCFLQASLCQEEPILLFLTHVLTGCIALFKTIKHTSNRQHLPGMGNSQLRRKCTILWWEMQYWVLGISRRINVPFCQYEVSILWNRVFKTVEVEEIIEEKTIWFGKIELMYYQVREVDIYRLDRKCNFLDIGSGIKPKNKYLVVKHIVFSSQNYWRLWLKYWRKHKLRRLITVIFTELSWHFSRKKRVREVEKNHKIETQEKPSEKRDIEQSRATNVKEWSKVYRKDEKKHLSNQVVQVTI